MDPISIALALAQFAPTIMRFLGAGDKSVAAAEQVVKTAQVVTGASTPGEALEMMKANQAMQVAFQQKILETDATLETAYLSDRADARKRDASFIDHGMSNTRGNVLAFVAISALCGLIFLLFFAKTDLPQNVQNLLMVLAGSLVAIVKDVYSFEFGSTRDSRNKTNMIADLAGNQKE